MATRKVLINRHTTGSTAPTATEMFHGEIAVAHETGKETLWTKNNANEMVPFISCAQTISIVSGMIESVDVVYDVEKKAGEPYINVETGGTDHQKVFTLSTSGVASEANLNALSAGTVSNFQNMTNILTALTDVVVTGITGDDIITATLSDPSTGTSNTYNLTHKAGHESTGFNKLATDAYGHVTASTAVTTEDIQALGFKTSAETGEDLKALSASVVTNKTNIEALSAGTQHDIEALSGNVVEYVKVVSGNIETVINELSAGTLQLSADTEAAITAAIQALDSSISASSAGKYFTALAIEDGKLVAKEEADIPVLSVESAGTGNVVSSIAVNDHKITYQTVSVATSEDVQALSAAVITFSAETVDEFASAFTAINTLSADTYAAIAALSAGTIQLSADTKATFTQLSAGTIQLSADTKAAIDALSAGTLHDIGALSGAVKANETNIATVSGDVIELSAATVAIETGLGNLSAVTLTGVSLNNTPLTVSNHIVSVPVTVSGSGIASATDSGSVADAKAVKEYVQDVLSSSVDYKGATDDVPTGTPSKGDLYIASDDFTIDGKNVETGDFIIYNGTGWDVIEKNLDGAITGNLTQDTVVLGDSTNSVKSLANGASGQVLTMAGGVPAWVDDPELSVVSAGTGNVLTDITVDDHEITFTKGITAASDADLQALSGVVTEFSATTNTKFTELSAYTKDVDDKVKALSAGTIQLSADTKAAIEQLSGFAHNSMIARDDAVFSSAKTYADEKVAAEIALLDSVGSASTTGHYLTSVTITDGKISAVGEVAVPAAVAITATTGAAVDTPSAVLTGVTADGTDNHNLTFGMSNKVFSAVSSDSAVTSQSAQTSVSANIAYEVSSAATITSGQVTDIVPGIQNTKVNSAFTAESAVTAVSATVAADAVHASAATKVDEKLTLTDGTNSVEYDGSAAQSVTFGTATSVSGQKSMSMDTNGVVDVDVIDCGTY